MEPAVSEKEEKAPEASTAPVEAHSPESGFTLSLVLWGFAAAFMSVISVGLVSALFSNFSGELLLISLCIFALTASAWTFTASAHAAYKGMKESRADKIIRAVDGLFGGEGSKIPEKLQKPKLEEAVSPSQNSSKEESKLWGALVGLGVGIPNIYLAFREPEKSNWIQWMGFGFILYGLSSLFAWGREDNIKSIALLGSAVGGILKFAFYLAIIGTVIWAGIAFLGWLGSIPLWAAIIIVLLILK